MKHACLIFVNINYCNALCNGVAHSHMLNITRFNRSDLILLYPQKQTLFSSRLVQKVLKWLNSGHDLMMVLCIFCFESVNVQTNIDLFEDGIFRYYII